LVCFGMMIEGNECGGVGISRIDWIGGIIGGALIQRSSVE